MLNKFNRPSVSKYPTEPGPPLCSDVEFAPHLEGAKREALIRGWRRAVGKSLGLVRRRNSISYIICLKLGGYIMVDARPVRFHFTRRAKLHLTTCTSSALHCISLCIMFTALHTTRPHL